MDTLLSDLIIFAAGVATGTVLVWLILPPRRRQETLLKERDEARQALSRYREEVDEHFLKTADSVNQLTSAYRSVHEQLSDGARKLCSEQGRRLALSRSAELLPDTEEQVDASVKAPLDYAPSHKGTLAEDYRHSSHDEEALAAYDHWEQDTDIDADADADDSHYEPPRDYAEGCSEQGCPPSGEKPTS